MKYLILALLALSTFGTLAAQSTAEATVKKNEALSRVPLEDR